MENQFEHCTAHVTSIEQDGFLVKVHAQVPSDSGATGRAILTRVDQISGHLRRMKCCESLARGQLAFARIDDIFHRVRALSDAVDGRVPVKFLDYGHEDWLRLTDLVTVDPPLSDVLTTVRPLAEDFYLDGVLLLRPLAKEELDLLSDKLLYQTVSCRLRRPHPDLSLIELATASVVGDRCDTFSNSIVELGLGKTCSFEDIAKYLRIKLPGRSEEVKMQPARGQVAGGGHAYSGPSPGLAMQPTHQQPGRPGVNARLAKYKREAAHPLVAAAAPLGGNNAMYQQAAAVSCLTPALADRKQYSATDGRMCTTAPTLHVKTTYSSYVSHVEDGPYNFTIQLKSSVEELLPKLRHILARHQNAPITTQLIPGSVVMAKSRDETLKRAVIMNVQPNSCKVYYIDFGSSDELPYSDVFQLPNKAAELSPAMAMQFCLAGLKSVKITAANKDYFARLLLGKQVIIRVNDKESNSPIQYCEMFWEGRSVREILLNINSPLQYSYQYPPTERETPVSVIYVNGPTQFFVQCQSGMSVVNKIQEALASYCPSQPRLTDLSTINIGSPVASLFEADQQWYRALVMGMDTKVVNVFYVDYGNRAEVGPDQLCPLNRDLVNSWNTQALECCLIGFDTVTPDPYMSEKMEEAVLDRLYTLILHSILSGFRLSVDLIDDQGHSVATEMKNILDERQRSQVPEPVFEQKKTQYPEDDRTSQHSSDSGGKRNKFVRPGERADRGKPNKSESRSIYSQHDDRSGSDYGQRQESRSDWQRSPKKPYMDRGAGGDEQWDGSSSQERKSFAKKDSFEDKSSSVKTDWRSGSRHNGERQIGRPERSSAGGWPRSEDIKERGSFPGRSERKAFNAAVEGEEGSSAWESTERPKLVGREKKFGEWDKGGQQQDGKTFGDRNRVRDNKFGQDRGNKSWDNRKTRQDNDGGGRKFGGSGNSNPLFVSQLDTEESWSDTEVTAGKPSVVISEYRYQQFDVGVEYKVFFVEMESRPADVYVQLAGCEAELEKIRQLIATEESAAAGLRPIVSAVLAMPVIAKFHEDGLLYRATIRSIAKSHNGQVDILFVDFGNTAAVSMKEVFAIPPELMAIPVQAVRVSIIDMQAAQADPDACRVHFTGEYLTLKPSRTTTINLEQVVEGVLLRSDGVSVAEAVKSDPPCILASGINQSDETQSKSTVSAAISTVATSLQSAEQPTGTSSAENSAAVTSLHLVPWLESLDLLVSQCLLAKVVKVVDRNVYAVKITATLDLVVLVQSNSPLLADQLTTGSDVLVSVISKAEDRLMVEFYDRKGKSLSGGPPRCPVCPAPIVSRHGTFAVSHKEESSIYLQTENDDQMASFLDQMFIAYETSVSENVAAFAVGDLCVAKSQDNNWYRARIVGLVDAVYTVRYIDYGNTEDINGADKLKIVISKFLCPEKCVRVVVPVQYLDMSGCLKSIDESVQCTFIKWDSNRMVWLADLQRVDASESLALEWIASELAAATDDDVPADPRRREPGWNLKKGDAPAIVVTHADSPNQFWAQFSAQLTDIEELQTTLQALSEAEEQSELAALFTAKYTEDGLWYRAIDSGEQVRFIDYGNADSATERKPLPKALLHPMSGYALALDLCVQPVESSWSDESVLLFDAFIDKDLTAEIKSVDFKITVDLKSGHERLASVLVEAGHAKPVKPNGVSGTIVPEDELPTGTIAGTVSASASVNDFYIQDNSHTNVMEYLNQRLLLADEFEVLETPVMDQYLIARFPEDSMWYRAQVISEDPLAVLFLDYGNIAVATEFRVLSPELASIPLMTWRCTANVDDESAEVSEKFTQLVDSSTLFDVTFTGKKGALHEVVLGIGGESLFKSEVAIINSEATQNSQLEEITEKIDSDSVVLEHNPEKANDQQDIKRQVMSVPNLQDSSTPTIADELQLTRSAHEPPSPLQITKSFYKNCVLAHSNGPYDFYVQTDDDHILIEEVANALFEGDSFPIIDTVNEGDFVVAQFPEDDAHYRAVVTAVRPEIVVHFVDHGNSCPAFSFHELPAKLKDIPRLAMRCSLESPSGGWSVDAIDAFTSLLTQNRKSLDVKIITEGDPNIVDVEIGNRSLIAQLSVADIDDRPEQSGLCQVTAASSSGIYIRDLSSTEELDRIAEQLRCVDVDAPSVVTATVDQLVAALHEGELGRGRVERVEPTSVFFIDTGLSAKVDAIYELPEPAKTSLGLARKVNIDWGREAVLTHDGFNELIRLTAGGAQYKLKGSSTVELRNVAALLESYLVTPTPAPPPTVADQTEEFLPVTVCFLNSPIDFFYQLDFPGVSALGTRLACVDTFVPIDECEVGQLVAAKCSENPIWYRVRITAVEPSVSVFLIDYGYESDRIEELKVLPPDLAQLPPLCHRGSLEPQQEPWTVEQTKKFREIVDAEGLSCSVVEMTPEKVILKLKSKDVPDMIEHLKRLV